MALFRLARSPMGRWLVRLAFTRISFLIPVNRLRETDNMVAFYHPKPTYPVHVLIVAKRPYASLLETPVDDVGFMRDVLEVAQALVKELKLEADGYRLISNGGTYQDVPHLHFHLVSGRAK